MSSEIILTKQSAASVSNPATGKVTTFVDTDGIFKQKDEAGVVKAFHEGAATAGEIATAISNHESAANPHPTYETSAEAQAKVDAHANLTNNPHSVTKTQVGLSNVDNTSDLNKPISTATQTALNLKYNTSNPSGYQTSAQVATSVNTAITTHEASVNPHPGYATDSDLTSGLATKENTGVAAGLVTAHELASDPHPQYLTSAEGNAAYQPLDADLTAIAAQTGAGFLVRTGTNAWSTRSIVAGTGIGLTNSDGVFGSPTVSNSDRGSVAVTTHVGLADPHTQYALESDVTASLALKENTITATTSSDYYRGDKTFQPLNKAAVGLSNVDNTSDTNKPVSTATQTALNLKYDSSNPSGYQTAAQVTSTVNTASTADRNRANHTGTQLKSTISDFAHTHPLSDLTQSSATTGQVATWNGTAWVPLAPGGDLISRTTIVQSVASVTPTTITELTSVSLGTGFYELTAHLLWQSTATTTGVGFRVQQITAALGIIHLKWAIALAANGTDRDFEYQQVLSADNIFSTSALTANANFTAKGFGIIEVTTAGTIAIQLRSETGTSVSIRPGSVMILKKVG